MVTAEVEPWLMVNNSFKDVSFPETLFVILILFFISDHDSGRG